jgi:hypothetical protein
MFLTYQKSLPSFDQHMVQLEFDAPDASKVYVEFQEGFLPLAAKYYEAINPQVVEVIVDKPTVVVEEVPVVDYVDPAPVSVHVAAEPVVTVEEVPVVDAVRLNPIPDPAPVVAPAQPLVDPAPVAKKARKASV